jgi:hypothetical protein
MKITIPSTDDQKIREVIQADPVLHALLTSSLPEVEAWLDTHLTTTAQAVSLLRRLVVVVWYLARGLRQAAQ